MRCLKTLALLLPLVASATLPGTGPVNNPVADRDLNSVVITEAGFITLSSDGLAMIGTDGLIQVNKPSAAATVRAAYLATASTGFSGYVIADGEIQLAGSGVAWGLVIPNGISCNNHWADVTGIVAPILNAAGPGITDLAVYEPNSYGVDGHALYVIFDDPATTTYRTAIIAFGAQATTGDQFNIGFGQPVYPDANTVIEMGLAISFGYARYSCQKSDITVNGLRLTSSAGGNDDGEDSDGALITVGGIGDSRVNPADPMFQDPCSGADDFTAYDDELYDVAGFVNDGDTGLTVTTYNPSGDDNVFVAHLLLDFAAVVGEGGVLTPADATNCLGELHVVTLTLQDDNGNPLVNYWGGISIVSGPNGGNGMGMFTDANGQITLTYTSAIEGTDVLVGTFVNAAGVVQYTNYAYKHWEDCEVDAGEQAEAFALGQNVPNPFNPTTSISFNMPETGAAQLLVYGLSGQLVKSVDLGLAPRGRNTVEFSGADLASGVYVYTLQSEFGTLSHKMVLLK